MKCENCQTNEAVIHVSKGSGFHKYHQYLCESCANASFDVYLSHNENHSNINQLLKALSNMQRKQYQDRPVKRCESCGSTVDSILKNAKFGCADCYRTFPDTTREIIARVQANQVTHVGKVPENALQHLKVKQQIDALKSELDALVEQQNFEEAVIVRDKIRALEGGGDHES